VAKSKAAKRPLWWVAILVCCAVGLACGRVPSSPAAPLSLPEACASAIRPPADVLTVPEPLPPIVNRSNVSPQIATAWARSVVRAFRVESWALANSRDDLFASGCLGDQRARSRLFGDEIYLIEMAKRHRATIVVTPADVAALTLVQLDGRQQAFITADQQVATSYAWMVTTRGPSGVVLVISGGDVKVVKSMQDGQRARDFYGGFYGADSWIGPLWFQASYYSCDSTKGRSICAP
jgi:hypothetical protein